MDLKNAKFYEVYITGEIVVDPTTKNPVKGDDGKIKVKYTRDSKPTAEFLAAGMTSNKFFNCELLEVNTEDAVKTSVSGKKWNIGPVTTKGKTVPIFQQKQTQIFDAITVLLTTGAYTVIKNADEHGEAKVKLNEFAIPGEHVEFDCGEDYFVMRRNKTTHVMEKLMNNSYNALGKLEQFPTIKRVGDVFLFFNQLEAKEAHINEAKNELLKYKVPKTPGTNDKTDQVEAAPPVTSAINKPTTEDI
jgi:hypothetical protein